MVGTTYDHDDWYVCSNDDYRVIDWYVEDVIGWHGVVNDSWYDVGC